MTSNRDDRPGGSGLLLGAGAALLMVFCCAVFPLLAAGGALAGVGAFLGNPWVIGAGITLAVLALLALSRRHRGSDNTNGHDCCPPGHTNEHRDPKDEQNR